MQAYKIFPTLLALPLAFVMLTNAGSSANRTATPSAARYEFAAEQNAVLKTSLTWAFGGKKQRGWQLYQPLICHLIGVEETADAEEFAEALSRWQRRAGLESSGVLNQPTWTKMVAIWQSRRAYDHSLPVADRLLRVGGEEFFHPERPEELRQVERQTYQAYRKMMAAAAAELSLNAASENYLKIISAFRSPEYQRQLRRQSPRAGRAGLAVNSPHFTGRALDLYVGGEPVSTRDGNRALQTQTRVYRWLVKNAGRFGFIPYFYEPWHWEYQPQ